MGSRDGKKWWSVRTALLDYEARVYLTYGGQRDDISTFNERVK